MPRDQQSLKPSSRTHRVDLLSARRPVYDSVMARRRSSSPSSPAAPDETRLFLGQADAARGVFWFLVAVFAGSIVAGVQSYRHMTPAPGEQLSEGLRLAFGVGIPLLFFLPVVAMGAYLSRYIDSVVLLPHGALRITTLGIRMGTTWVLPLADLVPARRRNDAFGLESRGVRAPWLAVRARGGPTFILDLQGASPSMWLLEGILEGRWRTPDELRRAVARGDADDDANP